MDYEKAYKAVLKTATQWIKDGCTDKEKICLECVFPELRESEDERIIRAIIDALYSHTNSINLLSSRGYQIGNIEAWLKKQKYDRMKPVYDNQDSFESALKKAWKDYNDSGARTVDGCEDNYVECAHAKGFREGYLFGLEKQKEQKPNIELIQRAWYMEGYNDRKFNREPKWIITTGEGGPRYLPNPKYGQQVEEQKPAWNEEDIYITNVLEYIVGKYRPDEIFKIGNKQGVSAYKICSWLKSLRPSWKPSQEQMDVLNKMTLGNFLGSGQYDILRTLYEQLKKL